MTIYLVCGTVGMYSDRTEWVVAWHETAADAEAHARAAESEAARLARKAHATDSPWDYDPKTQLDPFRERDYCGDPATYHVIQVERAKWPFPLPPGSEQVEGVHDVERLEGGEGRERE